MAIHYPHPYPPIIQFRAYLTRLMQDPSKPIDVRIAAAGMLLNNFPNDRTFIDECELPHVPVTLVQDTDYPDDVFITTVNPPDEWRAGLGISPAKHSQSRADRYRAH